MAEASDGRITKQLLKTRSGEFDIESIHSLCLRDAAVSDLGCIGECTSLERLDLSRNDVTRLQKLAGLSNLHTLNLSANRITSLEGLQALDSLQNLNLSGNLIGSVDSLRCLTGLDKLVNLRLKDDSQGLSNPVCLNTSYRSNIHSIFPQLVTLDGERIKGRGSEVFAMCREIDKALEATESSSDSHVLPEATKWLPDDFWKSNSNFEQSSLHDAEEQLRDLLDSCKVLSKKAAEELQDAPPSGAILRQQTI